MAKLAILATLIPTSYHTVDVVPAYGETVNFPTLSQAEDYCLTVLGASSVASTAQGKVMHAYGAPIAESTEAKTEAKPSLVARIGQGSKLHPIMRHTGYDGRTFYSPCCACPGTGNGHATYTWIGQGTPTCLTHQAGARR